MLLDKELIIEIRPFTKVRLDGQVVEGSKKESPMSLPIVLVQADKLELAGNSVKQEYPATAVGPRRGSSCMASSMGSCCLGVITILGIHNQVSDGRTGTTVDQPGQ